MATWQLQTAKAKLSELLRAVREEGPQTISVRGAEEFVVMRKADAATPQRPKAKSLYELLEPLRGLGDELEAQQREARRKGVREEGEDFRED